MKETRRARNAPGKTARRLEHHEIYIKIYRRYGEISSTINKVIPWH